MNFKLLLVTLAFVSFFNQVLAQSSYDAKVKALADEMAQQIKTSKLENIGILGFFTDKGEEGELGKLLAEDFSVYLTRPQYGYKLFNRAYIDHLIKENQLGTVEKLVEENSITELGKLQGLQGFVVGTYSRIGDVLRVRVKLLDAQTALQIGASMQNLEFDVNLKQYLGLSYGKSENNSNRGFTGPLNSNEEYNNPKTVSEKCDEYHFGDICFYNTLQEPVRVIFRESFAPYGDGGYVKWIYDDKGNKVNMGMDIHKLLIQPRETQCIYETGIGRAEYEIHSLQTNGYKKNIEGQGQILIEECKSKTFNIK